MFITRLQKRNDELVRNNTILFKLLNRKFGVIIIVLVCIIILIIYPWNLILKRTGISRFYLLLLILGPIGVLILSWYLALSEWKRDAWKRIGDAFVGEMNDNNIGGD